MYEREATAEEVPILDLAAGESFERISVEVTEISQAFKDIIKEQMPEATDEEIIAVCAENFDPGTAGTYVVTDDRGLLFLLDEDKTGFSAFNFEQSGENISMIERNRLSGTAVFSARTRGSKLWVEVIYSVDPEDETSRDLVLTMEYDYYLDFIQTPQYDLFEPTRTNFLDPTTEISPSYDYEMLQAAIDNYYGADFVLQKTLPQGGIVSQMSVTIREGAASGDHRLNMYNRVFTLASGTDYGKYWDEVDYIKSGADEELYYRLANNDAIEIGESSLEFDWNEEGSCKELSKYTSIDAFVAKNGYDPTAIWMYDVAQGNVIYILPTNPMSVKKYVNAAVIVCVKTNGIIKNAFNTTGKPNIIGSTIQKTAGGKQIVAKGFK